MTDDPQEFHYMTVLRELEKSVTSLHPDRPRVADAQLADLVGKLYDNIVKNLPLKLASIDQKIALELGAQQERQVKIETQIVEHIGRLTDDGHHTRQVHRLTGNWPPMIPVARMVEHFTALTIGLHSENPGVHLPHHVTAAFREAVLPGLAWGLMIRLYSLPKSSRPAIQEALGQWLRGRDSQDNHLQVKQSKVRFDHLLLVEAWFHLLGKKVLGQISPEVIAGLRNELATLMEKPLGDLDTELWERLGEQYLGTINGSERALVVARAQKHSAGSGGFLRDRLALFEAARHPERQPFRHQTEVELAQAINHDFKVFKAMPGNVEAGVEACGEAFWLARAAFGRHDSKPILLREEASTKALTLLTQAAKMFTHQARTSERLLTCLRYAAGFATNPRYVRSRCVMHLQELLVDLYAEHPLHRQSLVEIFRGRIAWQQWKASDDEAWKKLALLHYCKALELHQHARDGFDAEAPVHFFPELTVFLRQVGQRQTKELKTLEAVDFITQRNYGIYFDIEREKEMIEGGLESYGAYALLKKNTDRTMGSMAGSDDRENAQFIEETTSSSASRIKENIEYIRRTLGYNT